MAYPVDAGVPSHASGSSSNFIPAIWSGKLLEKFYPATVFGEIANTDYEGEIKDHGDEVKIRTVPSITISDYVKGTKLNYENPTSPDVTLNIDQGHYFAFSVYDIDKQQSDLQLMDSWSTDASEQMKIKVDGNILGTIHTQAAAENAGKTAGAKSGDIDLGDATTPLTLTKANVLDFIVDCGTILDEQNRPESDRYIVLPAWACGMVKKSDLKDASITGDGKSVLRSGRLGMIDRFTLYSSNNLNVASGKTDVVFGHKSALTFAGQFTNMETLKNPDDFGDLVRGLMVYGYEVINPGSLGHAVITKS